ncbi:NUDIX domain-containing protein [Mycobacterium lepromatosis]
MAHLVYCSEHRCPTEPPRCYCSIRRRGVQGGAWGLLGGTQNSHESPEETAVREAREEVGLVAQRLAVRVMLIRAEVYVLHSTTWT